MPKLSDFLKDGDQANRLRELVKAGTLRPAGASPKPPAAAAAPPRRAGGAGPALLPDFVALDFETTGLESRDERVIEVGAVRFHDGAPAEEFSSFVNPVKPIPAAISELTGISDSDVAGAPPFSGVVDRLLALIGNLPICGHQIDFDIDFLNAELKRLGRPAVGNLTLDTVLLSRIVLPGLAGYSLSHVARTTDKKLDSAHRALDDAAASGAIAMELLSQLHTIRPEVLRRMAAFAPQSLLKKLLWGSQSGEDLFVAAKAPPVRQKKLSLPEEPAPVDPSRVDDAFGDTGAVSRALAGFSPRESQRAMARAVAEALSDQSYLVAEAGTGTGKSLAYLIPAALYALDNQCRVLVSTHTRNLQDQLVKKDLPVAAQAVGGELRYAALKGRSNYLCVRRFEKLVRGDGINISPRERFGVLPLIRWAAETESGDIEEQTQFSRKAYSRVWELVSADTHHCQGRACERFGDCFLQSARQRALSSHIVVINHALFFSDVCAASTFLGKAGPVIFDEAHHLQECGHQHLRTDLDTNRINAFLELAGNLQKKLERHGDDKALAKPGKELKTLVKRLRRDSMDFLTDLDKWASQRQPGPAQYQFAVRDNPFRNLAGLGPFEMTVKEFQDALSALKQSCAERTEHDNELEAEIANCAERASQLKADYYYLCAAVTDDHVFWIEGNHQKGWVKLCGVPLDIGAILGSVWAGNEGGVVFTSATMSVAGDFSYFLPKLGLTGELAQRTVSKVFPSPFGAHQALCVTATAAPDPDSADYVRYAAEVLSWVHRRLGKNTLALFTSHAMLKAVHSALRSARGVPKELLLAQGVTGNRNVLLEQFRGLRGAVLLGADSFWEGIDAPGEACEIVVIARLPFPVPTHPLTQALAKKCEEANGESFISYSIPEAVIKFRQGTGRLIRSPSDRGVIVVLDNRVATKGYGARFMQSIAADFQATSSPEEMVAAAAGFFGGERRPSAGGGERLSERL